MRNALSQGRRRRDFGPDLAERVHEGAPVAGLGVQPEVGRGSVYEVCRGAGVLKKVSIFFNIISKDPSPRAEQSGRVKLDT